MPTFKAKSDADQIDCASIFMRSPIRFEMNISIEELLTKLV
jgi:hypothetical protein